MKTGIFDSGLGGLSVLDKVRRLKPEMDIIYYADEGHLPYGEKTKKEILSYATEAVSFLLGNGCGAVIIACNTATSAAIRELRERFTAPIIGIEPAVKPALKAGKGKILVMATPVTVKEEKLRNLIAGLHAESEVDLLAMPELVRFCEREEYHSTAVKDYIAEKLSGLDREVYSGLVLGCTHFNHFREVLAEAFENRIPLIDGSLGTARRLFEVLRERGMVAGGTGTTEYYLTGGVPASPDFISRAERMLAHLRDTEE